MKSDGHSGWVVGNSDDIDYGVLMDPKKSISHNTIVVSKAISILAESVMRALPKFLVTNRLSRSVVEGFLSLVIAAHFQSLPHWFRLLS